MNIGASVRERRIELGMKADQLASAAGLQPGVIERIEAAGEIESLSILQLRALSDALGMDLIDDLSRSDEPEEGGGDERWDAQALGAVLHRVARPVTPTELACGLGWTRERVERASEHLAVACRHSGFSLVRAANGLYIRAAVNAEAKLAAQSLPRTLRDPFIDSADVPLVLQVARQWHGRLSRPLEDYGRADQRRLRALIDRGVLTVDEHSVALAQITAESLKPVLRDLALVAV